MLIERIRALPLEQVSVLEEFLEFLSQRESDRNLVRAASRLSEASFAQVWDNADDADYDRL
jgi:hypothetical protein